MAGQDRRRGPPRCFFWLLHRGGDPLGEKHILSAMLRLGFRGAAVDDRDRRFDRVVHLASLPWHVSRNVREIKYSIAPRAMRRSEDHSDRCKSCIYTRPERAFIRAFVLSHDVFPL